MKCKDDKVANWELFRQQWEDYEIAKRIKGIKHLSRNAAFGYGKRLPELSVEQKNSVTACLDALEAYFEPKTKRGVREICVSVTPARNNKKKVPMNM